MKNRNTRLLDGKNDGNKSHAELDSASSTQAVLLWKQQRQALKTLKQVQGDGAYFNNNGFTLIELLVVVLIIGILAGVALPQYNKAVRKARLSEVTTTFNSISKAIDMYLLENGWPNSVSFSGTNKTANLDIAIPCATEDAFSCYTKVGQWSYNCSSSYCEIYLGTSSNADKSTGNKWLDGENITFRKFPDKTEWGIGLDWSSYRKDVCPWWKSMYGADRVVNSVGEDSGVCEGYW